ncbi:MAG TPA: LPXTG cell wall anchor domain-containing protein [Terrimesophilobacter sp.]
MLRLPRSLRAIVAVAVAAPLVLGSAWAASASHFRASGSEFTVSGDTGTWNLQSAWMADDADFFATDTIGGLIEVTELASLSDAPGTGSYTEVTLALTAFDIDSSNSLFDLTHQTFAGDLSGLGDGVYEIYLDSCCRVYGVQNGPDGSFSQWMRFTKSGGSYNVAPRFNSPTLYSSIDPVSGVTLSYSATDPEGAAVVFALIGDDAYPYYGGTTMACSSFSAGVFTLSPTLCGGEEDFSAIYTPGSFWAVKVSATDAAGNQVVTDTLLRVASAPTPYIDGDDVVGNGTVVDFTVVSEDNPVDSWTVTCVGIEDSSDVVSRTLTNSPATTMQSVRLSGFTIGESYLCEVSATNGAGTGESADEYQIGPIELNGVQLVLDVQVGDKLSDATAELSGAGLEEDSEWTLIQHSTPVTLASGLTDEVGAFSSTLEFPTLACVPGVHTLTLTGEGPDGPATDEAWYELDGNCTVLQFSRVGAVTAGEPGLAETGVTIDPALVVGGIAASTLGLGLLLLARRRNDAHAK